MTGVVLVHGTWGAAWSAEGSPFRQMLDAQGFRVILPPFEWSGDVSGIPSFTGSAKHSDWKAAGFALALYLERIPYEDRNIIAHSHGGQCVAYCAAKYSIIAPIRRLITVSTPVRSDMEPVWTDAKPRIGYWLHISSKNGDWMAKLGQLFDGSFGWKRQQPQADQNALIPNIGHTGILGDPTHIPLWQSQHLLQHFTLPATRIGGRSVV